MGTMKCTKIFGKEIFNLSILLDEKKIWEKCKNVVTGLKV